MVGTMEDDKLNDAQDPVVEVPGLTLDESVAVLKEYVDGVVYETDDDPSAPLPEGDQEEDEAVTPPADA